MHRESPTLVPYAKTHTLSIISLKKAHWAYVAVLEGILVFSMVHQNWYTWDHRIIGLQGDSSIYLWFLAWWGHAIQYGLPLGVTHLVSFPWGNNILWDTGVPLIFIPLSMLWHARLIGLSLAYNLATFLGWWLSGVAAYVSLVMMTRHSLGSLLGSILTLTSAYYTNQALGHTDLMWVGFSYLLFATIYQYVRDPSKPKYWLISRFVPLAVALWLTNQEYFVTTEIMIVFGLALWTHYAAHGHQPWSLVGHMWSGYAAAVTFSGLALIPLAAWQFLTPDQPFHSFSYINVYQINLANLMIPVHTWIHLGSRSFTGNVMEQDGYLGVIFLVGLLAFLIATRHQHTLFKKAVLYWTGGILLLSMGDTLIIAQHTTTGLPLPGVALSLMPLLKDIVFDRLMWGVFFGLGLLVALIARTMTRQSHLALLVIWTALVVITWWPQGYPTLKLTANPWITKSVSQKLIRKGEVLLVFPFDTVYNPNNNVLYTQIANHFRYRLAEGYLTPNDAVLEHNNVLASYWDSVQLYGPHSTQARLFQRGLHHPRRVMDQFLHRSRTGAVVLEPMAHQSFMKQWLSVYLGPPSGYWSGTWYWLRPASLSPPKDAHH